VTAVLIRAVLVGLVAYRLARAIAVDSISEPARTWTYWRGHSDTVPEPGVTHRGWAWLYGLISCPFCCSWWIALAVYLAWLGEWNATALIGATAAAGIAAIVTAADRAATG
jgi:hypothetical protein